MDVLLLRGDVENPWQVLVVVKVRVIPPSKQNSHLHSGGQGGTLCKWEIFAFFPVRLSGCTRKITSLQNKPPMSDGVKIVGTEQCDQKRLAELALRPDTIVYEYISDAPDGTMSDAEQLETYRHVVEYFDESCRRFAHESNESMRERVLNTVPQARRFQNLYAKIFAFSTVRACTAEEEAKLDITRKGIMIMLVERSSGGGETAAKRAMHNAMRLVARSTTAADLKDAAKVEVGEAAGEGKSMVVPLHRDALGPTSVKQRK